MCGIVIVEGAFGGEEASRVGCAIVVGARVKVDVVADGMVK